MNLRSTEQRINTGINNIRSRISDKVAGINEAASSLTLPDVVGQRLARNVGVALFRTGVALTTIAGADAIQSQFTNVSGMRAARAVADTVIVRPDEYFYVGDSNRLPGPTWWSAEVNFDPNGPEYAKMLALRQARPDMVEGTNICMFELEITEPNSREKKGHWIHAVFRPEELPGGSCGVPPTVEQPRPPAGQDNVCFEQVLGQGERIISRDNHVVHGDGGVRFRNGQPPVRLYDTGPNSGETGHITEIIANGQEFELFADYALDAYCQRDASIRNENIRQGVANLRSQGMQPDVNLLRYDTARGQWVFEDRPFP